MNQQDKHTQITVGATGKVLAVCTSKKKGIRKRNVNQAELRPDWGIVGDAHAADWHRQVSLLAWESIEKVRAVGLNVPPCSYTPERSHSRCGTSTLHPGQHPFDKSP